MARSMTPRRNETTSVTADAIGSSMDETMQELEKHIAQLISKTNRLLATDLKGINEDLLSKDAEERYKQAEYLAKVKRALDAQGRKLDENEQRKALDTLNNERRLQELKLQKELNENQKKLEKELRHAENQATLQSDTATKEEKREARISEAMMGLQESLENSLNNMISNLDQKFSALTGKLDNVISSYASFQLSVSARLQGTNKTFSSIEKLLSGSVGTSPFIKTQKLLENVSGLVNQGIAYNIEQRAFLQTISENIANTFDAANSSLLRLIRIQQSDSTAARLGMEANLTQLFNELYLNTEYLSNKFDDTSAALLEASSTMTNEQAIAFEYQVQKWLGAMYSLGFSDSTIGDLATAVGYLGSGNIEALSSSNMGNLITMAAARIGTDLGSLFINGLDESNTNELLASILEYTQELALSGNQIVKSKLAETFGLSISDLQASLHADIEAIRDTTLSYSDAIYSLQQSYSTMGDRMHMSTLLENLAENAIYSLGTSIAQSGVLYGIWKITGLIQEQTGGINIPFVSALGTGVDINTTVENLIRLGVVGIGTLGMIGDIVTGLAGASTGAALANLGILSGISTNTAAGVTFEKLTEKLLRRTSTSTGQGLNRYVTSTGMDTSSSVSISSSSGEDFASLALSEATSDVSGKITEQEEQSPTYRKMDSIEKALTSSVAMDTESKQLVDTISKTVTDIYSLLNSVVNGTSSLQVRQLAFSPATDSIL